MTLIKIILTFFIISLQLFGSAQNSNSFVHNHNYWYHSGGSGGMFGVPLHMYHISNYFDGDTVINSVLYKKMFSDIKDTTYSTPVVINNGTYYTGAFREASNIVYMVESSDTSETLYADFNLNYGDTLNYRYYNGSYIVTNIDTIQFGNINKTRYYVADTVNGGGGYFIQGIGCHYGVFHGFGLGIEGDIILKCFSQYMEAWSYSQQNESYCLNTTPVTVGNNLSVKEKVVAYPNPTAGLISLQGQNNLELISIHDIMGRRIKGLKAQKTNNNIELDLSSLNKGIYIVTLFDTDYYQVKIILQ